MSGTPASRDQMAAIELEGVCVRRQGRWLLRDIHWRVGAGQRWAVLGANGAGKTTLLKVVHGEIFPTFGSARVLGHRLGQVDLRRLRQEIGLTGAFLESSLRPETIAADVVLSAKFAAKQTWWHSYGPDDARRARELLELVGCGRLADAQFGDCSSGERQRIMLARVLMPRPRLLILDEPMANLDLGGREQLLAVLSGEARGTGENSIYADNPGLSSVLVTHHTEEIPAGTTHLLLLKDGTTMAAGPIAEVLTQENLSRCFGMELELERVGGRWRSQARGSQAGKN